MSALAAPQQDIYSLLVPLNEHRMLIPRANVAEVTGYRECAPPANAPPWLLGHFQWEKESVPLMSIEGAIGASVPDVAPRTRIVLLRTLTDTLKVKSFGIVTQGFPQLVRVNAMVLEPDATTTWPPSGPVLCQVKMVNQHPLIPDIEQIEKMLSGVLAS